MNPKHNTEKTVAILQLMVQNVVLVFILISCIIYAACVPMPNRVSKSDANRSFYIGNITNCIVLNNIPTDTNATTEGDSKALLNNNRKITKRNIIYVNVKNTPFTNQYILDDGSCYVFSLSTNKISIWCSHELWPYSEQRANSGLSLTIGVDAYKRLRYNDDINRQITNGLYITQGSVITSDKYHSTTYEYFIGDKRICFIVDLEPKSRMHVVVTVTNK